jgi:hypothetical protein
MRHRRRLRHFSTTLETPASDRLTRAAPDRRRVYRARRSVSAIIGLTSGGAYGNPTDSTPLRHSPGPKRCRPKHRRGRGLRTAPQLWFVGDPESPRISLRILGQRLSTRWICREDDGGLSSGNRSSAVRAAQCYGPEVRSSGGWHMSPVAAHDQREHGDGGLASSRHPPYDVVWYRRGASTRTVAPGQCRRGQGRIADT